MGPKARSLTNAIGRVALLWVAGCTANPRDTARTLEQVDISDITADTVEAGETRLLEENGVFYRDGQPYSGFIRETYDGRTVKLVSVYLGMRHGLTTTFYPDGNLRDVRSYRDNVAYGRHYGYWENGTMKFDYQYIDDRKEGVQKQWYRSGKPYAFLTFQDDREVGMQQAWRESGRLYINYEVRDGIRYGLQKSVLCSEIEVGETT